MNSIQGKKKHCLFNPTNLNLFFVYNNFIIEWKQNFIDVTKWLQI